MVDMPLLHCVQSGRAFAEEASTIELGSLILSSS